MKTLLACAVLSFAACAAARAQESLFIAHVERITLAPNDSRFCPPLCPASGTRKPDGSTFVCVSNDGGCQKTEVQVERVLLGDTRPGLQTFETRLGEWGKPDFPLMHQPILVHLAPGRTEWAQIWPKDGREYVKIAAFHHATVGGIDLAALPQAEKGYVALDTLLTSLRAGR